MRFLIIFLILFNIGTWPLSTVHGKAINRSKVKLMDDMLLEDRDDYRFTEPRPPQLWDHGDVFYEISPELYSYKSMIKRAMDHISSKVHSCVRFRERYIEENYIHIVKGNGCRSHVGMISGMQELWLDFACLDTGNVIHELMHSLGFFHEHSRADRDKYLDVFIENVIESKKLNFEKIPWLAPPFVSDEFDYDSIMIYGEYAFSKNGAPTMQSKDWLSGHRIVNPGLKISLSRNNARDLKEMYCPLI